MPSLTEAGNATESFRRRMARGGYSCPTTPACVVSIQREVTKSSTGPIRREAKTFPRFGRSAARESDSDSYYKALWCRIPETRSEAKEIAVQQQTSDTTRVTPDGKTNYGPRSD